MNIIADSGTNSIFPEFSEIFSESSHYFAQIKESTLAFLQCGQSFDEERQRLEAEYGKNKGNKLFKELIDSLGWWYDSATDAINLSRSYFGLPSELLTELDRQPQWWSLEGLKKLLKLSIKQIQKALAETAAQLGNSLSSFFKPFTPKKFLTPGEPITDENWEAIAELITKKLGLDAGQLEEIRSSAQAIAQAEALNTDHLVTALSRRDYDIDLLFPPPKAKAYTQKEIERIKLETKAQALTEAREQVMAEIQPRLKALEDERASDRLLIEQLEQQIQILLQRMPTQQTSSTVGTQALAALLQPTGESHRAMTVPPSTAKRDFQGSSQKVKTSQKTSSPGKGFGQLVNQKHRR